MKPVPTEDAAAADDRPSSSLFYQQRKDSERNAFSGAEDNEVEEPTQVRQSNNALKNKRGVNDSDFEDASGTEM